MIANKYGTYTIYYGLSLMLVISAVPAYFKKVEIDVSIKMNLTIFYESVHTESKKFILEELEPLHELLGPYLSFRRREEKMAAAAEARERAQRMRRAQLEAAQREKEEKHANAGQGKLKRLQEAEERRLAQEKKILEIEERRKAEELARQLKFEEEQRRAEAARKRQQAEQEKCKREAAKIEKEMQQAKQQYQEKERQRLAMLKLQADQFHTPMKSRVVSRPAQPEARANGFELLEYRDSDDEEGTPAHIKRRNPEWGQSKNKHRQLAVQSRVDRSLVERLMGARGQTPDLLQLFPAVDRRMLKRTSSAVWHTPPHAHLPTLLE